MCIYKHSRCLDKTTVNSGRLGGMRLERSEGGIYTVFLREFTFQRSFKFTAKLSPIHVRGLLHHQCAPPECTFVKLITLQ